MQRRTFIKDSGIMLCACAAGPTLLAACGTAIHVVKDVEREGEYMQIKAGELDVVGFAVIPETRHGFPLYISVKDGHYYAVLLKCSHKGCELEPGARLLKCPCHGSTFRSTGEPVKLPATEPLQTFPVSVSEGIIRIKVG